MEYALLSPVILISSLSIAAIVADGLLKYRKFNFSFSLISLIIVLGAAIYTITVPLNVIKLVTTSNQITKNMLTFGGFAAFFDMLFCVGGILVVLASKPYIKRDYIEYNEFYTLLLISVSGMMLMVHANNLLILFIGVEIMSISFYVLAGFFRTKILSNEASVKYFLLGAFATGFLVYGMAMIYGAAGSFELPKIYYQISINGYNPVYLNIGLGLLLIGLSFKIAAFPFHQWAPDVYQGSPTVVSAFMSTAGKAAAIAAFIVIAKSLLPLGFRNNGITAQVQTVQLIMAIISAGTMLIGNFSALVQKNVKRMLAYSSVAHAGYLLMGITANNPDGRTGIMFYAASYLLMQTGAFIIVSIFEKEHTQNLEYSDYSGLRKNHPWLAAAMAMFMLSLAGIPPFAGFFGKYYLFASAIKADFLWLTIVAVISSIISMYYYIGLILQMYFREPGENPITAKAGLANVSVVTAIAGIVLFGIFPSLIVDLAEYLLKI